jgi:hypothetical protein
MTGGLTIGELALRAGVTTKTIRFDERKGILPPPRRAANRYRVYGDEAVDRLRFVKRAAGPRAARGAGPGGRRRGGGRVGGEREPGDRRAAAAREAAG